jgi:hypothetical protein
MAKRNLFLGTASGKIGDIVVYRAGGTQRSRVRVVPKDAKTSKQMAQRSKIGGVVNTYRAGKGLFGESFESRESKQSAYNAFAAVALPTAPYLVKELADAGGAIPMPMAFSRGSLPSPFASQAAGENAFTAVVNINANVAPTTVAQISQTLIDARPCCFKNGSVVILAALVYDALEAGDIEGLKPRLVVFKFVLDTENDEAPSVPTGFTIAGTTTAVTFSYNTSSNGTYVAAAIVLNDDSDGMHVSSADGLMSPNALQTYNDATTDAAGSEAADSYGASGDKCLLAGKATHIDVN